jgi:protein gp37
MKDTGIAWTDWTVNFVIGCTEVSEACDNCYARTIDAKFKFGGQTHWGKDGPRYLRLEKARDELLAANRKAKKTGKRLKVFINSMSDTFEDHPKVEVARAFMWPIMEQCDQCDIQLLTKRTHLINKMVPDHWLTKWPAHVWIGTTVENQKWANVRIPQLLRVPAPIRWLSCEPLLGRIELPIGETDKLHWIVGGGESGIDFREMNLNDYAYLYAQCLIHEIAFFAKQDSGKKPGQQGRIPDELFLQEFPVTLPIDA